MKKTAFLLVLMIIANPCFARTITVDNDGPADFNNIQAAIDDANDGDTVIVAPGTYTGPGNRDIDFLGKAITVRSTDPNDPDIVAATVIDCEGDPGNKHRGFYFHSGEGPASILNGLTIINGLGPSNIGGAILCDGSSPTITRCNISNSMAYDFGGGIACRNGSPIISNSTVTSNSAKDGWGGGIYCWKSNPVVTDCTISGNGGGWAGGGIFCEDSNATIANCIITNNIGGGICLAESTAIISNCIISNNRILDYSGHGGGGIISDGGRSNLTISDCLISGNRAFWGGGLTECYGKITNCIISDNFATYGGGGLYGCGGSITNCTITGNFAESGGGFYEYDGPITNCIIWDNIAGEGSQLYNSYSSANPTYSCIQDWEGGGEGNISSDPQFALDGDYHLMPESPCIDAGTNSPAGGLPTADRDGIARPLDGDGDANAVADMGAYEYAPNSPAIAVSAEWFYFNQDWPKPEPQTLLIRNCGSQPLNWEIVEDCNWLEVAPADGVSSVDINEVTITVDPNGLAPGIYNCTLEVQDANASNSPVAIRVMMPVGEVLRVPSVFPNIQAAIDAADTYDVVVVSDGTYTGTGNKNLDFYGKTITVTSESGPNNCIIDCEKSGYGFYFQNAETEKSLVDGLTVIHGTLGILCYEGSPTINNCIISSNSDCGIFCFRDSNPKISNCTITNNTSNRYDEAGGIRYGWLSRGMLISSVTNCTISNNTGGGISWWAEGILTVTDCNISNNEGCGISSEQNGTLRVANCDISNNYSSGVSCREGSLTITNCTITGNTGHGSMWGMGGGIWWFGGDKAIITGCKIAGNQAYAAGGVFCLGESIIENCIISNNLATHTNGGGGGVVCQGNTEIKNSTLCSNSSEKYGGGIWVSDGYCSITNCILWGNTANQGNQIFAGSPYSPTQGTVTVTYSDIQSGQDDVYVAAGCDLIWGSGNIDADPCFVQVGYWDSNSVWIEGDYHLLEGSPCINAGDPNYIAQAGETDLDGVPRVLSGRIDMGAYEHKLPIPAEVDIEPDTLNLQSKGNWLTCYIQLPEDYNVTDIDPNTVFLEDTISAERFEINNDAAIVKFSRSEVQGIIEVGEVELIITGELIDGTVFEGAALIRVINKGTKN